MNLVQKLGSFAVKSHKRDDVFLLSLAEPVLVGSISLSAPTLISKLLHVPSNEISWSDHLSLGSIIQTQVKHHSSTGILYLQNMQM
uniref:Uncharacterized protein n=1 Tax=Solanum lycopersicum TaxID=4081 RepID=A0A3Q7J5D0_SOLLC